MRPWITVNFFDDIAGVGHLSKSLRSIAAAAISGFESSGRIIP
jgi:hypothetical protein